ncbi:MAG: fasciclin domain-containing protein [Hyphomonas sp.]|nr:fasciclin domain-containing protein [Hyphomonas sp.]
MKRFLLVPALSALCLAACSGDAPDTAPVPQDPVQPYADDIDIAPSPAPEAGEEEEVFADTMDRDAMVTSGPNLMDAVAADPRLSTLYGALEAAGLDETLATGGPYTVFAPTNDAFDALPDGQLEDYLRPEKVGRLVRLLEYHVVEGNLRAANMPPAEQGVPVASLNGLDLSVRDMGGGTLMINQANLLETDVEGGNGVVHVIDSVLVPRATE